MKIFLFLCLCMSFALLSGCDNLKSNQEATLSEISDPLNTVDSARSSGSVSNKVSIDEPFFTSHNRQNSRNPTARGRP